MVRTYKRKANKGGNATPSVLKMAAERVIKHNESLRKAADSYNINFMTLQRYIKKSKVGISRPTPEYGFKKPRQVFTDEQELAYC
ncbi:Uncharacterised protein g7798 [Pycnogonum litorale]